MIVNRYPGKCQSCGVKLAQGEGFAYKNGYKWFSVCKSTACHSRLGVKAPIPESRIAKELNAEGFITMPYNRDAIPLLRSMPGARWQPDKKQWQVSIEPKDLPRVIEVAEQLQLDVSDVLLNIVAEGTKESREALERAECKRSDGAMLFGYQKKGVEFLALHDRAILADDMGLGKTVQSLIALPVNERVILIAPAAVKYNWQDEIRMWRSDYTVHVCSGRNSFRLPEAGEIIIVNYEILPDWLKPTKKIGVTKSGKAIKEADLTPEQAKILSETTLIADECHKAKNWKAMRSQKIAQLSKKCKRVWFLTGTPLMNRPEDLYGVLQSGDMQVLGSWNKFVSLFGGYRNNFGGYEFGLPVPEVPEKMKRVMLRRLKTEVLKDLPPKTYQKIEVPIDRETIKKLNDFLIESGMDPKKVQVLEDQLDATDLPGFESFSHIRALLAQSRIPAMLEIVEEYEETETPLLVFSAHKAPIKVLKGRDGWAIIDGDTPAEMRFQIQKRFQAGELKGVGLTINAGGVGLTLTHASHALFVDLDWTPAMNIQSEDRICRIGQKSSVVLIKRMVSNHPLDLHIQKLLEWKLEIAYRALEASIKFNPPKPRPLIQDVELIEETEEELINRIKAAENEANREEAFGKLERIAGREAAKVNEIPEPELTVERKDMLREALDYMIGRCDGANQRDGIGFNKPDASIGHWIYRTGLRDEDELPFRVLERILIRYRRQLKGQFEEIWCPKL
jgi:SWI/SNF-related matrix-associated actin-dependent regulator 1 of chromatin subfamily A